MPLSFKLEDFLGAESVSILDVWAADTSPDCESSCAYLRYQVTFAENVVSFWNYLARVDPATGATTPYVPLGDDASWEGIATDPRPARRTSSRTSAVSHTSSARWSRRLPSRKWKARSISSKAAGSWRRRTSSPTARCWLLYDDIASPGGYQLLSYAPGSDLAQDAPTLVGEVHGDAEYNGADVLMYDPPAPRLDLPAGAGAAGDGRRGADRAVARRWRAVRRGSRAAGSAPRSGPTRRHVEEARPRRSIRRPFGVRTSVMISAWQA